MERQTIWIETAFTGAKATASCDVRTLGDDGRFETRSYSASGKSTSRALTELVGKLKKAGLTGAPYEVRLPLCEMQPENVERMKAALAAYQENG